MSAPGGRGAFVKMGQGRRSGGRNMAVLVQHLETQPGWADAVRFNGFTQAVEVRAPWPPIVGAPPGEWEPMDEVAHVLTAVRYFQENGFPRVHRGMVEDALRLFADGRTHHPVREYLGGLDWDGVPRIHQLAEHYFSAYGADSDYLALVSRYWMISAVARIYEPGCKVDHLLVLVGEVQGEGKSSCIQALMPEVAWFTDDVGYSPRNKDAKESLRGKWVVELSEMHILRSDPDALKSFITTGTDRYRPPYGRTTRDNPRQSAFIGTCNELDLPDWTGNRRYWPFRVNRIDLAAIEADRDQLWAEAVAEFQADRQWWPSPGEESLCTREQEKFAEYDTWQSVIYPWLSGRQNFTLDELFSALKADLTNGFKEQKADQQRAAVCLKRLNCKKTGKRRGRGGPPEWQAP